MKNIKKKFNLVDLAEEAFHSCVVFGVDTIFKNREKDPTRFLLVSKSTSSIGVANYVLHDYFKSEEYEDATQKKIHIFNLDQFDYDYSAIKISKTKKYKGNLRTSLQLCENPRNT